MTSTYRDDKVYLFYHPNFKPGACVGHIVKKKKAKVSSKKNFVPKL